ncbi:MAG: transketolase [Bacteroidota bacterium]
MSLSSITFAKEIRKAVLKLVYEAKASHIGGALSMTDLLAVLYSEVLHIDPKNPLDRDRDRFLLSKGHACTALYATLALKDFFPLSELSNYSKDGSMLLSHTSHKVPGVELSTGSLGHALSVACGISLAGKRNNNNFRVYCLVSDGELDEGSNWEAILFAPHHQLSNLTLIVDYNKIQSFGTIDEVLKLDPLHKKFEAFGWRTLEIDGHNHDQINSSLARAKDETEKPTVIIAHTIKGKGINFMENKLLWHYRSPSAEEFAEAIKQLEE